VATLFSYSGILVRQQKPFLVADKFIQENIMYNYNEFNNSNTSLCLFNQNNNDFCEAKLTIIEQKLCMENYMECIRKC
jgi:hypothetical protein